MMENDSAVLVVGMAMCFLLHLTGKIISFNQSKFYRTTDFVTRYDWDQRLLNLIVQVILCFFYVNLIFYDRTVLENPLYGYSHQAHIGFLIVVAFYIYDSILYLAHPKVGLASRVQWLAHHALTVGLLFWDTSSKRISAFPAAIFLISSAGHIGNELRWFSVKLGVESAALYNGINVLCNLLVFFTCIVPPPYMLKVIAAYLNRSVWGLIREVMQSVCIMASLAVYLPHCVLQYVQVKRTVKGWNKGVKSVRANTIDPNGYELGTLHESSMEKKES